MSSYSKAVWPVAAAFSFTASLAHAAVTTAVPAPVPYTMTEHADDGDFVVDSDRTVPVDANSTLVVAFKVPPAQSDLLASPEWQRVNALLATINELSAERARLEAAQVDLSDPAAVKAFQQELTLFGDRVIQSLRDPALSGFDLLPIVTGQFDKGPNSGAYGNLARWLKQEIERLRRNAAAFTKNKEELEVTVQAFLEPLLGSRKGLHIEGYDQIPAGELRPIDRYGVRLTPAESQRLAAELSISNAAADMIREIQKNSQTIKDDFRKLLADLQAHAAALEQALGSGPTSWSAQIGSSVAQLRQLAAAPTASASFKSSANALADDLTGFQADLTTLASTFAAVKSLRTTLQQAANSDLQTLLLTGDGIATKLDTIETNIKTLATAAQNWGPHLESARQHLDEVVGSVPVALVPKLLPPEVQTFFTTLAEHLPKTVGGLKIAADILHGGSQDHSLELAGAGDTLATTSDAPIAHALDDLPDARLELARSGLTLGDHVTVKIRFQQKTAPTALQKPKVVFEQTYVTETTLIGLHRTIGADLIFARAVSGTDTAKKWKPNAAALVNFHYTKRAPKGFWKGWNWVDPGVGIHLASLNQGDESVEVGAGVNLTLLQGLVSAGYGYNLSVTRNRDYFLLGINLLKVLTEARSLAGGPGL